MTSVDLLSTLKDLKEDEFKEFTWYLQQHDFMKPYPAIKGAKLEKPNKPDTVDLMVKTFELHGALEVTRKVLQKIPRNDLLQSLPNTSSGPEGKHLDVLDQKNRRLVPAGKASNKALFEPAGDQWQRKYACELTIDTNTLHRWLKLSHNNRKVTYEGEYQSYPDHPDRFDVCTQLLCRTGLTGRCYWEVEWGGEVVISVSYRGIRRRGGSNDCLFGRNNQSWSLLCSGEGYSACHNKTETPISSSSSPSDRVAVYVDCPAGSLSFYRVSSDTLIHLHTFNTTFTEPLYPGFGFWSSFGGSVSLCSV
ncbi:stonustoxin subunit alpha-like [Anarrhichthys ocellatus]|uniref:stonustoxin subunit alpha-like n=1 Tax=Anarrhichthys ocellatus TaxID=433405 RepID=UPI0012ED113C|nr:stonustoxin subunit alpha-like [Anarrhichthys ocellatus]XP_031734028.1 stonustoxin subunit alpha-like [Anarrhichthys ocellatus]